MQTQKGEDRNEREENLLVGALIALVVVVTGCSVEVPVSVTCTLKFESENDVTENRFDPRAGGDYYSMPMDGGEVILLLGAILMHRPVCKIAHMWTRSWGCWGARI